MFYLLIAGSRDFSDYQLLKARCDYLLQRKTEVTIVSGGARGADKLAEQYATENGYPIKIFPAQWNTYGKSAGYRRNEEMHRFLLAQNDSGVVCFWDGQNRGTAHNFELCSKNGLRLRVFNYIERRWIKV